jgi:lipopolysaccharide transport protein LptA
MNQTNNQRCKFIKWLFAGIAVPLLVGSVFAAPLPDDEKEINTEAGWSEVDLKNGVLIYHAPVIITQGSRRLESDLLTVWRDADGKLNKAIAKGKPARYQGLTDADPKSPILYASAETITWDAKNGKLILTGNAKVTQNGDVFTAPVMEYYMEENRVVSPKNEKGRTKIILQPRPGSELSLTGKSKQ